MISNHPRVNDLVGRSADNNDNKKKGKRFPEWLFPPGRLIIYRNYVSTRVQKAFIEPAEEFEWPEKRLNTCTRPPFITPRKFR